MVFKIGHCLPFTLKPICSLQFYKICKTNLPESKIKNSEVRPSGRIALNHDRLDEGVLRERKVVRLKRDHAQQVPSRVHRRVQL